LKKRLVFSVIISTFLLLNGFELFPNMPIVWATIRRVPEDYPTIQKAINAAYPGDTILVAKGTYAEYVLVNKSVILQGTNRESKIVGTSTPSRVIDVKVSNVKIFGFTVQGPTANYKGIYVEPPLGGKINNVNVTDNNLIGNNVGVLLSFSTNCFITNNNFDSNYYGVRLFESDQNTVSNNLVNGSTYYGINLYSHSDDNKILRNTVAKGRYAVLIEWSDRNLLELNTISLNTEYGIRLSYPTGTLAKGNTVSNNKYGVYIWNCSGNQFYHNNFIDNTYQVQHYDAALTGNIWDTNIRPRTEGNYWSDYTGLDNGVGVGRWGEPKIAGDDIGDTKTPHLGVDWYPLMHPWAPGPNPVAIFTYSPPEPIVNQPATFNASKSYDPNGTIVSYTWNFDDGTPPVTEPDPITEHTFTVVGNYTVTLTVTDNDGLTNSTSKLVRVLLYKLLIDLFTQKPEPYSGRGPNQPSDAFEHQAEVILYGEVTYNYEPVDYKPVSFRVVDPGGVNFTVRSDFTNASGIAETTFRLPSYEDFGTWTVFAGVEVSGKIANDSLTFQVGWMIEIIKVEAVDQYGVPQNSFVRGDLVYFDMDVKNIAFTSKSAVLTVTLLDDCNQTIGVTDLSIEVPPGTHEFNLIFNVLIPKWSYVGMATVPSCAFTNWPWIGGVPYCPEKSTWFYIVVG